MTVPRIKEHDLMKLLRDQGWRIEDTTDGHVALAPDGVSRVPWHSSMFRGDHYNYHGYDNNITKFVKAGLVLNGLNREGKRKKGQPEAEILDYIMQHPGCSTADVSEGTGIHGSTVSHTLGKLESRQLIRREKAGRAVKIMPMVETRREPLPAEDLPAPEQVVEAKMLSNGTPSAGPVVVKQQVPDDPAERLRYFARELADAASALLLEAAQLRDERDAAVAKVERLTDKLGSLVDEL